MNNKQTSETDSFFRELAVDYEPNRQIHDELITAANEILCRKSYSELLNLVDYAKKLYFHASKDTRVFFLTLSSYAQEIASGNSISYFNDIHGFNELVSRYRYITLLLRRFETFSYDEAEFKEAVSILEKLDPSPRLVDNIISNELFQFKEFVALNFYFEIIKSKNLAERMDCIKLFSTKYPANEWSSEISEIIKELENGN